MKQDLKHLPLSELCEIAPPKKQVKGFLSDADQVTFLPMEDLGVYQKEINPIKAKSLKDVFGSYTYFAENDLLVAKITPCFENGKMGIAKNLVNGVGFGSSEYMVFRTKNSIIPEYLFYFLSKEEFRQEGIKSMTGAVGHKRVSKNFIENLKVPVPSLAEQNRIIALLDECFAAIAKAKANAEQNLRNAQELFESYLKSIFAQRKEEWAVETLQSLLDRGWITSHLDGNHGSDYPRKEEFQKSGIPYVSANCLKGNMVDMSLAKFLSRERASSIRKGVAVNNDVLFAHNATVGPVALLQTDEEKVILGTSLTYYRCNPDHILPEYLANYMRSREFKSQYELVMRQSTRNQVPITKQREFTHIIPPIEIQKQIVDKLAGISTASSKLESVYQQKLEALAELQKTILQKAFAGELTTNKVLETL